MYRSRHQHPAPARPHCEHKRHPIPCLRQAFTLIELLSAIAVIAILGAILIPVIGSFRASADHTTNVSNLRQLGASFQLYAQENNNTLPLLFHTNSDPAAYWRRATLEYVELDPNYHPVHDDLFNSPFLSPVIVEMIKQNGGSPYITSYAVNERLVIRNSEGVEYKRPLSSITDPSNTVLATEGLMGSAGQNRVPGYTVYEPTLLANYPHDTYQGGRDFLMVDGSIRFFEVWDEAAKAPYNNGGENDLWSPEK